MGSKRTGFLDGRRIIGDQNLGFSNSRFYGNNTPALAAIEKYGTLFANGVYQSIYAQSATQNYNINTLREQDGRKFRYSFAGTAIPMLGRLVACDNTPPGNPTTPNRDGYEGVLAVLAPIGQAFVDIADVVVRPVNYYQGGIFIAYGVTIFHQHKIVASALGTGAFVRLYLDEPITTEAITVIMGVDAYPSQYNNVCIPGGRAVAAGFESFVGMNLIPITINNYFWLQTEGLALPTPTVFPGQVGNRRDLFANTDGTICDSGVAVFGYQRVGHLVTATYGAPAAYGDNLIYLELDE